MLKQAKVIDFEAKSSSAGKKNKKIPLSAGRSMILTQSASGEVIQLLEKGGQVSVQIRMAEAGPVVSVNCADLELKASDHITLSAKKVEITAEESAVFKSNGVLKIESSDKMGLKSENDVVINGSIIHLN